MRVGGARPIVADTGAIIALTDASDRHHAALLSVYEQDPHAWILPWAILPEVDYLILKYMGAEAERLFVADVADGRYSVEWHNDRDVRRAAQLNEGYRALELGLVDALVMATAERVSAEAIATLDLRDFGAVTITGEPRLIPRDL